MRRIHCAAAAWRSLVLWLFVSAPVPAEENPWMTPNRSTFPFSAAEYAQFDEMLQPCSEHAVATLPAAIERFAKADSRDSSFHIMVRRKRPEDRPPNFFITYRSHDGDTIEGKVASEGVVVDGRRYRRGKKLAVDSAAVMDWVIIHPDRPEEGNLIGRYLLLRQDDLLDGPCDAAHPELLRARIFRETFSFAPPAGIDWILRGGLNDLELSLFKAGGTAADLHAIFVGRYADCNACRSPDELVDKLATFVETGAAEQPQGFRLQDYRIAPFPSDRAVCAKLSFTSLAQGVQLAGGQVAEQVIREIAEIACVHPSNAAEGLTLGYIHHYVPGARDPDLDARMAALFASLAFARLK
jgi:hypothetical protein